MLRPQPPGGGSAQGGPYPHAFLDARLRTGWPGMSRRPREQGQNPADPSHLHRLCFSLFTQASTTRPYVRVVFKALNLLSEQHYDAQKCARD